MSLVVGGGYWLWVLVDGVGYCRVSPPLTLVLGRVCPRCALALCWLWAFVAGVRCWSSLLVLDVGIFIRPAPTLEVRTLTLDP